jgi:hypothetical protein
LAATLLIRAKSLETAAFAIVLDEELGAEVFGFDT